MCPGTTHKSPRGGGRDAGLHTVRSLREWQAARSCNGRQCAISPVSQKRTRHVRPRDCHTHHAQRSVSGGRASRSAQHKSVRNETLQLCVCAAAGSSRVSHPSLGSPAHVGRQLKHQASRAFFLSLSTSTTLTNAIPSCFFPYASPGASVSVPGCSLWSGRGL